MVAMVKERTKGRFETLKFGVDKLHETIFDFLCNAHVTLIHKSTKCVSLRTIVGFLLVTFVMLESCTALLVTLVVCSKRCNGSVTDIQDCKTKICFI